MTLYDDIEFETYSQSYYKTVFVSMGPGSCQYLNYIQAVALT